MKINFLALNENLQYQWHAVREMSFLNWISSDKRQELKKALETLEEFNTSMISENNGIEIVDASAADKRPEKRDCTTGFHDWNHERWTERRTQIYKCSICGTRREEV